MTAAPEAVGHDVRITLCGENGPALVRGADVVRDREGKEHPVTRPVVGVCMCGRSQRAPWCDGTHKFIKRPS